MQRDLEDRALHTGGHSLEVWRKIWTKKGGSSHMLVGRRSDLTERGDDCGGPEAWNRHIQITSRSASRRLRESWEAQLVLGRSHPNPVKPPPAGALAFYSLHSSLPSPVV